MLFLLSGEGPTDLGKINLSTNGPEFVPGPMAYFIDGLFQEKYDYSILENDTGQFRFISEAELSKFAQTEKTRNQRYLIIPGLKNHHLKPHGFMARALGWKAASLKKTEGIDTVIPVFFRDTDSPELGDFREKLASVDNGFAAAGFPCRGVAMLAKPKSEAWLLCLADGYQNGDTYEQGPGSDGSQNSLKARLREKINPEADYLTSNDLVDFIKSLGLIKFESLSCELVSFAEFMNRFNRALTATKD